jgi:hypothetical protein
MSEEDETVPTTASEVAAALKDDHRESFASGVTKRPCLTAPRMVCEKPVQSSPRTTPRRPIS